MNHKKNLRFLNLKKTCITEAFVYCHFTQDRFCMAIKYSLYEKLLTSHVCTILLKTRDVARSRPALCPRKRNQAYRLIDLQPWWIGACIVLEHTTLSQASAMEPKDSQLLSHLRVTSDSLSCILYCMLYIAYPGPLQFVCFSACDIL